MALPIGVKSYELRDVSMPELSYPGGRQARVALNAAKAAGVSVKLNGGKLSLKASGPPPEAVVAALKNHKAEIIALLEGPEERVVFGSTLRRGLEDDPGPCQPVALVAGHDADP